MKSRLAFLSSIGLVAAAAAVGAGCAKDNSVGGDNTGQGGTSSTGQGGQTASGTGGTSASTGTGGFSTLTGTGGSSTLTGTGGFGTGGSGATTSGSGGTTDAGTLTGTAGSGGSGAGAGTTGAGGSGAGVAGTTGVGGATSGGMGTAGQGGPSLCPVAGATECDGFEGAAPGAAGSDWTITTAGGATMTVDTTKFYRGSKSMHFVATAANAQPSAFIVEKKTFTGTTKATNNDFWGRYFILSGVTAATDFPQGHAVYGVLAGPTTLAGADGMFHFVGGSRGILQAEIRNSSDAYTDDMKMPNAAAKNALGISPAFPLASDGWQCWEWHLQDTDSYDFYLNSAAVPAMQIVNGKATKSGNNFAPLPTVTSLSIGWQFFGTGANSGWIDEVAIGPNRIGCGN